MKPDTTQKLLVKKRDLAALFGVSPRTVDCWIARRLIPHIRISRRLFLFDPAEVRAALARQFEVAPGEDRP